MISTNLLETYLKDALVILIGQVQTHLYTNQNSIILFEDF